MSKINAAYCAAAVCGVVALTRLGHNPLLTNFSKKAFIAWAMAAIFLGVAAYVASMNASPAPTSRGR